jgi:UDP:flavonoid glycosyltransferase YjiC (YdhE family)
MEAIAVMPVRALFNVGDYESEYDAVPANIEIASWYPQPSVISQADAVIHHGGNNSFNECLYFGKPALIMPYVWDGHDNAKRVTETGHGFHLHRNDWTPDELHACIDSMLTNKKLHERLQATSAHMRSEDGPTKAAEILDRLVS